MAPEAHERPREVVRLYCGMGNHLLKLPITNVKDPKIIHFARYLNPEQRHDTPLCRDFFNILGRLYRFKIKNALKNRDEKKTATSISDVSSSQRPELTSSSNPSSTTSNSIISTATTAAAVEKRKQTNPPPAAQQESSSSYESDDDDPNSNLSLNAVNGTRLPHIQPIPKRRTVHLNKEAMAGTWPRPLEAKTRLIIN
ncbi:uncharacterized protein DMAD_05256 [Drosophila madeirensis]|uniref:Uncharacterized protein n=1 Tax=Drosophila madeirensis TaxID=30013 RepID=A0AAU9FLW3_DROMD